MSTNSDYVVPLILRSTLSLLSLLGSGFIVQHVLRSPSRRRRVLERIMLGMSTMDFIAAMYSATAAFQLPKETGAPWAFGSWNSCIALAFLGHGSKLASVLYNATLALYYYLAICHRWTDWKCKQTKSELWWHVMPLTIGWTLAIAGLPLALYNPLKMGCLISAYPPGCQKKGSCTRGDHAAEFSLAFFHVWVWAVFVWLVLSMALIYCSIVKVEQSSKRFRSRSVLTFHHHQSRTNLAQQTPADLEEAELSPEWNTSANQSNEAILPPPVANQLTASTTSQEQRQKIRKQSTLFATQAFLFCLAYFVTWIFPTISTITLRYSGKLPIAFVYLGTTSALHGFWNALIYIRPRYIQYRQNQQHEREMNRVSRSIESSKSWQPGVQVTNQYHDETLVPRFKTLVNAISLNDDLDEEEEAFERESDDKGLVVTPIREEEVEDSESACAPPVILEENKNEEQDGLDPHSE